MNNNIKKILEKRGKSQGWLSRVSKVERTHLNKLVNGGVNNPSIGTITKIAKALGLPVEEIWKA